MLIFDPSGRLERRAPDLLGAKPAAERAQEVGAQAEAPDASLVQRGVDLGGDLRVVLGQLAPVHARVLVVGGVQPVVEDEEVAELRDEVARVVVLRPGIRVDVLDVVDEHHRPQREERRREERAPVDERTPPSPVQGNRQREEAHVRPEHGGVLGDDVPEERGVLRRALAMYCLSGSDCQYAETKKYVQATVHVFSFV